MLATTKTPIRVKKLALLTSLAIAGNTWLAGQASAQDASRAAPAKEPELKEVTVTATRSAKPLEEVAATVSVITDADKEKTLATDIRDLVRYEPGVSVRSSPSRFTLAGSGTGRDGNAGFTIRGIGGNQVLMQADGIRLPLAFSFGAINFGRGDYLDLDLYKTVEIVRGPASALYGSDGLAGAVSFLSKDPADFVSKSGDTYAALKTGYASANTGRMVSATLAGMQGDFSVMLVGATRRGSETGNKARNDALNSSRTKPNPQSTDSQSGLFKLVWQPNAAHRFKVTAETLDNGIKTDGLTARSVPPLAATSTIDFQADDTFERNRVSLGHEYQGRANSVFEKASWLVYEQKSKSRELGFEDRNAAADRVRDSRYDETTQGVSAQASGKWVAGSVLHQFVYGADFSVTEVSGIQDGVTPAFGETFPLKRFPDTDYKLVGAFLLDDILLRENFSVTPGLRFDSFKLEPRHGDPLFPDTRPATLSDSAITPRVGAVWKFTPSLAAFVQYARGFRAPTPVQVNNGFTNALSFYQSIANPDLKPESSETVEIGVRGSTRNWSFDVVAFDGRYKDFIFQAQVGGNFAPGNPAIFQYVNLSKVRISGLEAKGKASLGGGLSAMGSFAYAKGDDETVKQPLDTIDPAKLVLGLEYARATWDVQLVGTAVRAKDRLPPSASPPTQLFASPSYRIADLFAYWKPVKNVTVNFAAFNMGDKTYWVWQDVRGLLVNSTTLDAYTQSGHSFSVSLKAEF